MEDREFLPPFPRNPHSTTLAAALRAIRSSKSKRAKCYKCIEDAGEDGCTDDEIMCTTGMSHQTCTARMWELRGNPEGREPLIVWSGRTRKTRTGCDAKVWVAVVFAGGIAAVPASEPSSISSGMGS